MKSGFRSQVSGFSPVRKNAEHFSVPLGTKNFKLKTSGGFSLIELLVSMGLFIVVLTVGIGALLVLISSNLKAQNIQESVSNVQFALDSMAREIRTGYSYYCSSAVPVNPPDGSEDVASCDRGGYLSIVEGGKSLTGDNPDHRIAYCFAGNAIWRKLGTSGGSCGGSGWVRLTSPNVSIDAMHFNVHNAGRKLLVDNDYQPNVTIFISGTVAGVSNTSADFTLQTTVTQRVLDL
jgi:type II secretory pathway pseudopilin PulG